MDAANSTSGFTSILASAKYGGVTLPPQVDQVLETITNLSPWTLALTLLAVCVAYDQSRFCLAASLLMAAVLVQLASWPHRYRGR